MHGGGETDVVDQKLAVLGGVGVRVRSQEGVCASVSARARATELKGSSGASVAHGGAWFREHHRGGGRYRAKTRRERRGGLTGRSLVARDEHSEVEGGRNRRSSVRPGEEEEAGVVDLGLLGLVLVVVEVEEGLAML